MRKCYIYIYIYICICVYNIGRQGGWSGVYIYIYIYIYLIYREYIGNILRDIIYIYREYIKGYHIYREYIKGYYIYRVLHWCYTGVTLVLHWCYTGVTRSFGVQEGPQRAPKSAQDPQRAPKGLLWDPLGRFGCHFGVVWMSLGRLFEEIWTSWNVCKTLVKHRLLKVWGGQGSQSGLRWTHLGCQGWSEEDLDRQRGLERGCLEGLGRKSGQQYLP